MVGDERANRSKEKKLQRNTSGVFHYNRVPRDRIFIASGDRMHKLPPDEYLSDHCNFEKYQL
jgi:hypothetical protein